MEISFLLNILHIKHWDKAQHKIRHLKLCQKWHGNYVFSNMIHHKLLFNLNSAQSVKHILIKSNFCEM